MTQNPKTKTNSGQRVALFTAGVGIFWVLSTWAGGQFGLSNRMIVLFDIMALFGFGWALWMTYGIWRSRQKDEG